MYLNELAVEMAGVDETQLRARFPHPFLLEQAPLRGEDDPGRRRVVSLGPGPVRVGRSPECQLCLSEPVVSNYHAELRPPWRPGAPWSAVDLGSTNGSYLNDRRLGAGEFALLRDEAVLRFGSRRFSFLVPTTFFRNLLRLQDRQLAVSAATIGGGGDAGEEPGDASATLFDEEGADVLAGALGGATLVDLLERVEAEQRTGRIEIRGIRLEGRITFRSGRPWGAATSGGLQGVTAIVRLLGEREGTYRLLPAVDAQEERQIGVSFAEILLSTLRHDSRAALEQSERRLRSIVNSVQDGIVTFGRDGKIQSINSAACRMFRCTEEQARGRTVRGLLAKQPKRSLIEPDLLGRIRDLVGARRGGKPFPLEVVVSQLEGEPGYTLSARDVSDRWRARQALRCAESSSRQVEKMDALSRLALGTADDFTQVISVVQGYVDLLWDGASEDQRTFLASIQRAGERAADFTGTLRSIAGRSSVKPGAFDLNARLGELVEARLQPLLNKGTRLRIYRGRDLAPIRADWAQVEQALVHLVMNALEAMPDGGELAVATANVVLGEDAASLVEGIEPGRYARLTVTDVGCGMSPEVAQRAVEPFFTTKGPGSQGLGLALVHGLVRRNGGYLALESQPGQGTRAQVYLPQVNSMPTRTRSAAEPSTTARHCCETILVVDDQESIRELLSSTLRLLGYRVLVAADGVEGLEVARSYGEPIHLLLTDVMMPRMSGPKLARAVREIRQETRVLFMSGHIGEDLVPGWPLVCKPFSPRVLADQVRRLLDTVTEEPERLVGEPSMTERLMRSGIVGLS